MACPVGLALWIPFEITSELLPKPSFDGKAVLSEWRVCLFAMGLSCRFFVLLRATKRAGASLIYVRPSPPRAIVVVGQLCFAQEEEEDELYDDQELAIQRGGAGAAVGGRGGGPTELLLELDDWVQFRVREIDTRVGP